MVAQLLELSNKVTKEIGEKGEVEEADIIQTAGETSKKSPQLSK